MNIETSVKTIRGVIDRFNKLESSIARHEAERNQLLAGGTGELDDKTCQRFALVSAGVQLGETATENMRGPLIEALGLAVQAESFLANQLRDLYGRVDVGMEQHLLRSVPEDLKDVTNVRESKTFQAEHGLRIALPSTFGHDTGTLKTRQIRDHLNGMLVGLDSMLTELKRATSVGRKYGMAA